MVSYPKKKKFMVLNKRKSIKNIMIRRLQQFERERERERTREEAYINI